MLPSGLTAAHANPSSTGETAGPYLTTGPSIARRQAETYERQASIIREQANIADGGGWTPAWGWGGYYGAYPCYPYYYGCSVVPY